MSRTIAEELLEKALQEADRCFVTSSDGMRTTYSDLALHAQEVASALRAQGVSRGDHVALLLPNRQEFLFSWFALSLLGAIIVPLNPEHRGETLLHFLNDADVKWVIVDGRRSGEYHSAIERAPGVERTFAWMFGSRELSKTTTTCLDALREGHVGATYSPVSISHDINSILYTSGTTGLPKGVMISNHQYLAHARVFARWAGLGPQDNLYTCLPLFHHNAECITTIAALCCSGEMFLAERFSASRFWHEISQARATVFNAVGAMLMMLVGREPTAEETGHRVRLIVSAGLAQEQFENVQTRFGVRVTEVYGMSELGLALMNPLSQPRPGSLGVPVDHCEAAVVRDDGTRAEVDEPGELILREREPGILFRGYYNHPDATARFRRDGWLHTGDRAHVDAAGYFYFGGRIVDSIRRRGENISPAQVELILTSHPGIELAAVVGIPSPLGEHDVLACVVPSGGWDLAPEEVYEYAAGVMPAYMLPEYIRIMRELPLTATNRVKKHVLRDAGIDDATWCRSGTNPNEASQSGIVNSSSNTRRFEQRIRR